METFVRTRYPECFNGVGKLKGVKIKLHVDTEVEPVAQPVCTLPFSYCGCVEKTLDK